MKNRSDKPEAFCRVCELKTEILLKIKMKRLKQMGIRNARASGTESSCITCLNLI